MDEYLQYRLRNHARCCKTSGWRVAVEAHMIDNNNLYNQAEFAKAAHMAWELGTLEQPLTDTRVLDIVETWHGCRQYRRSHVKVADLEIPAWETVPDEMRHLYGGRRFSFNGDGHVAGYAELMFSTYDLPKFMAWMWLEHVRVQPLHDGNKRAAVLILFYWLGRAYVRDGVQTTWANATVPFESIIGAISPWATLARWFATVLRTV